MTVQEAQQLLLSRIQEVYNKREAISITDWVLEQLTGKKKIDRLVQSSEALSARQVTVLQQYIDELLTYKPVQYVLHEAWFCGLKMYVNEQVLIPRPETEELVEWIKSESPKIRKPESSKTRILDIGTGSGCIPVALKKKLSECEVYACDVSATALEVAKKNAGEHHTTIHFLQLDFLDRNSWNKLPQVDILVSNPPYVPQKDKATMHPNVLNFEPHLALFVENDDPLLFYKAIAEFGLQKLTPDGTVFAEIHEDLGDAVKALFLEEGFSKVEIRKDMQGKERMVKSDVGNRK